MNSWLQRCIFNLDLNRESVSEPRINVQLFMTETNLIKLKNMHVSRNTKRLLSSVFIRLWRKGNNNRTYKWILSFILNIFVIFNWVVITLIKKIVYLKYISYRSNLLAYLLTYGLRLTEIKIIIKLYLENYLCTMQFS